jgi:uncharacterized protein YndB with AHSA1/START domain
MIPKLKTMELAFNRTIGAAPPEVFDAWLDPTHPATPFSGSEKLLIDPRVDGMFYFRHVMDGTDLPHFGRFTVVDRPRKVQYTWMSRHTRGLESIVTVTFQEKGGDTLLTLNHANLPDDEMGRAHDGGWKHYLGLFDRRFATQGA